MTILREFSDSWLLYALLFGSMLVLIPVAGAPIVVASGAVAAGAALMFVRPHLANFAAIFLVYLNVAVIFQQLPYAQLIGACFVAPLAIQGIYGFAARRENLRGGTVFYLMLLLLMVQLLSTFGAQDASIAAKHMLTFATEGILLYFLVINAVTTRRGLTNAIAAALSAAALLAALSVYQAVTHSYDQQFAGLAQRDLELDEDRPTTPTAGAPRSGVRLSDRAAGPVGDPNRYAQILLVLLPLATFRVLSEHRWLRRVVILGSASLLLCGVLLSYSRGAFVTIALMIALLVVLGTIRLLHVAAGTLLIALAVPFLAPSYYDRIQTLIGAQGLVTNDASVQTDRVFQGRATEMLASFYVFLDHPLLGVGPGQYMPFYSEQYQLNPDVQFRQVATHRRGHNLYLEMAAETGLIGIVVFVSMPLILLRHLWRARRMCEMSQPELAGLATAFCFSIIAYLGTGVFLHLAFERYYWLLLALATAALHVIRRERDSWLKGRYA
jgi:putative inorganic carbon (HCO3(-)) transporter